MITPLFLRTAEDTNYFKTFMKKNGASWGSGGKIEDAMLTRVQQSIIMYTFVLSVSSKNLVNTFQHTRCAIVITFDIFTLQKLCDYFFTMFSISRREGRWRLHVECP